MKRRDWSKEERQERSRRAVELNLGGTLQGGYHGPWWKPEELALLGTMPDEELAKRIDKTEEAVRRQRLRRKIAPAKDRRRKGN
jgi:hypothetical protein